MRRSWNMQIKAANSCSRPFMAVSFSRNSFNLDLHRLMPIELPFRPSRRNNSALRDPAPPAWSDAQRRTIFALSTPPGKAAVAVVRISGPDALQVWKSSVQTRGHNGHVVPEPLKMKRCHIVDPNNGEILDDGLAVFFKGVPGISFQRITKLTLLSPVRSKVVHNRRCARAAHPFWTCNRVVCPCDALPPSIL